MDIQSVSINMAQAKVQEQAAVHVLAKGLEAVKEQAAAMENLISSAQAITDPKLGQNVNVSA